MRDDHKKVADFTAGWVCALTLFAFAALIFGTAASLPQTGSAEGLAALSARFGGYGGQTASEPEPEKEPKTPKIGDNLAGELIRLSGFGGWDIEAAPKETEEPEKEEESAPEGLDYPGSLSENGGKIVRKTYSYRPSTTYVELPGGGLLRNCTDIDSDYLLEQAERLPDIEIPESGEPLVLIMHTHTTECYEPSERERYDAEFSSRTTELDKSVAEVGQRIADELAAEGIGVIHDETVHDYPRYTGAYDRSAETVAEYLEKYPTIQIVIDVHRDAIEEDGVRYAPAVDVGGRSAAQVMIICGCMNVPQYRYNLRIAARLQSQMESDWPGLTRPILFDERNYNQEMTKGSFLIEMGSNANSLDEALYSGELVGKSLAKVIEGLE